MNTISVQSEVYILDCPLSPEYLVTPTAVYNILGINQEGKNELIGVYLGETEGAKFWLSVLNNLKTRGVQDIIVACVDGLKGLSKSYSSCISTNTSSTLYCTSNKNQSSFCSS